MNGEPIYAVYHAAKGTSGVDSEVGLYRDEDSAWAEADRLNLGLSYRDPFYYTVVAHEEDE